MKLNEDVARFKRELFADLSEQRQPRFGEYDSGLLAELRDFGTPQIGSTRFAPDRITIEFIYSKPGTASSIFSISIKPQERIVFLPVPQWVIESIWQGDIDGSYHYESEAMLLVKAFEESLEPSANAQFFGPQAPKRRE